MDIFRLLTQAAKGFETGSKNYTIDLQIDTKFCLLPKFSHVPTSAHVGPISVHATYYFLFHFFKNTKYVRLWKWFSTNSFSIDLARGFVI